MSLEFSVSAVLSNYNGGRFLREAVRSALEQEFPPLEVLVVDDGSTDGSLGRLGSYRDRVRWLGLPHAGQAEALNAALAQCRGEWVAFLETDDIWDAGKLAWVRRCAQEVPAPASVQHAMRQVDARLRPLPTALGYGDAHWRLEDFLEGKTLLCGLSALAVRRDLLRRLLPLPADLITCVDEYLQPRLLALGPMRHFQGALGSRRVHGANFYAGIRTDPKRLAPYLKLRRGLDRHLLDFLEGQGARLSPKFRRRKTIERLELEFFLCRGTGDWFSALARLKDALLACGFGPYAAFKACALAAALVSPGLYETLHGAYERRRWLARWRGKLLP